MKNKPYRGIQNDIYDVLRKNGRGMTPANIAEELTAEIPSIIEDIAFIIQDYQKLLIEHKRLKEDFDALHRQYCNIQSSMSGVKKLQVQLGRR